MSIEENRIGNPSVLRADSHRYPIKRGTVIMEIFRIRRAVGLKVFSIPSGKKRVLIIVPVKRRESDRFEWYLKPELGWHLI